MTRTTRTVHRISAAAALSGIALSLAACDAETNEAIETILVKALNAVGLKIERKQDEPVEGQARTKGEKPLYESEAAQNAQANAELLQEVYRVVYMRDPENRGEFGSYVDTLNQGASFEGVYNGFTHSSVYRRLEVANPGASPTALTVFGKELARLTLELPQPTRFDTTAAQPLAMPVQPGADPEQAGAGEDSVIDFPVQGEQPQAAAPPAEAAHAANAPKPSAEELAAEYSKTFVGGSIYTLKRILGDEALKVMDTKKDYKENLALWYSKWVVQVAEYKVDFGIEQRNLADESLHYRWAVKSSEDRIKWEVLNRVHRLLNHANQQR